MSTTHKHLAHALPADIWSTADAGNHLQDNGVPLDMVAFEAENDRRAWFALEAVTTYAKRTGIYTGESIFVAIQDLLGDLMHLFDALRAVDEDYARDIDAALDYARTAYLAEVNGQP